MPEGGVNGAAERRRLCGYYVLNEKVEARLRAYTVIRDVLSECLNDWNSTSLGCQHFGTCVSSCSFGVRFFLENHFNNVVDYLLKAAVQRENASVNSSELENKTPF